MPVVTVPATWTDNSYYLVVRATVTKAQARTFLQNNNVPAALIDVMLGDASDITYNTIRFRRVFGGFSRMAYNGNDYWIAEIDRRAMPIIGDKLVVLVTSTTQAYLFEHAELAARLVEGGS